MIGELVNLLEIKCKGRYVMDDFKRNTIKDYTAWDLNCPKVVKRTKALKKVRSILKRRARRKMRKDVKGWLDE